MPLTTIAVAGPDLSGRKGVSNSQQDNLCLARVTTPHLWFNCHLFAHSESNLTSSSPNSWIRVFGNQTLCAGGKRCDFFVL